MAQHYRIGIGTTPGRLIAPVAARQRAIDVFIARLALLAHPLNANSTAERHIPSFARYIGIDYSGAETPRSSLPGLRVYMARGRRVADRGPASAIAPLAVLPRRLPAHLAADSDDTSESEHS